MSSLVCPLCCIQSFDSVVALREHLLYFIYRPLLCAICSVSVNGIYELTRHLEGHTHVAMRKFQNPLKIGDNLLQNQCYTQYGDSYFEASGVKNVNKYTPSSSSNEPCSEDQNVFSKNFGTNSMFVTSVSHSEDDFLSYLNSPSIDAKENKFFSSCTNGISLKEFENKIKSEDWRKSSSNLEFLDEDETKTLPFESDVRNNGSQDSEDFRDQGKILCSLSGSDSGGSYGSENGGSNSSENGGSVRAFVCKMCGVKLVGKDLYFKHLLENCNVPLLQKVDALEYSQLDSSKPSVIVGEVDFRQEKGLPKTGINHWTFKNEAEEPSPFHQFNIPVEMPSERPMEALNFIKSDESLSLLGNASTKNSFIIKFNEDEIRYENDCIKTPIHFRSDCLVRADTRRSNSILNVESQQTYIHKKFDHDQGRKADNFETKRDIQCCIQNFQSLLVNKLNLVLEANLPKSPSIEKTSNDTRDTTPDIILDSKRREENDGIESSDSLYMDVPKVLPQSEQSNETNAGITVNKCPVCRKSFLKKTLLHRHIKERHSDSAFRCKLCKRQFRSLRTLKNHSGTHEQKKFKCSKCPYMCHTGSGLRTHMCQRHGLDTKQIRCSICGEHFKRKYGLQRHIDRRHSTGNLACKYCDKVFSCKEDLTQHINIHLHEESLTCKLCREIFTSFSSLKRHASKHKINFQNFKCEVCSSIFTRKDSLLSHMKLHGNSRHYVCKCGKGFNKLSHLRYHEVKHKKAQFICQYCNKTYKFKISFKNHKCKVKGKVSQV